jgi:hypothetical protein
VKLSAALPTGGTRVVEAGDVTLNQLLRAAGNVAVADPQELTRHSTGTTRAPARNPARKPAALFRDTAPGCINPSVRQAQAGLLRHVSPPLNWHVEVRLTGQTEPGNDMTAP